MTALSIMLVDDHPVVREGYRRLLERRSSTRVVAEATDAAEAYRLYRDNAPGLVIMDLSLPGPGGLEALRHIRQWDGRALVLIFTMHTGAAYALKSFAAGARGFVTKSSPPEELLRAVDTVMAGGRALSADIARELAEDRLNGEPQLRDLSTRETEILRLLALGMTKVEIADRLSLSLKTVQNYHYLIKTKTGANTDAQLVWIAVKAGILETKVSEVATGTSAREG
jgi:DNA-binding NarL/FixJ family response regulator